MCLLPKKIFGPGQVAWLVGALSSIPKGCGSIPSLGTYLGYRFNQVGVPTEGNQWMFLSLKSIKKPPYYQAGRGEEYLDSMLNLTY